MHGRAVGFGSGCGGGRSHGTHLGGSRRLFEPPGLTSWLPRPYFERSRAYKRLVRRSASPPYSGSSPKWGSATKRCNIGPRGGGGYVKLLKRFAVAMGSLLALAFAGGAHVRW